jgi:hypothetical protein
MGCHRQVLPKGYQLGVFSFFVFYFSGLAVTGKLKKKTIRRRRSFLHRAARLSSPIPNHAAPGPFIHCTAPGSTSRTDAACFPCPTSPGVPTLQNLSRPLRSQSRDLTCIKALLLLGVQPLD